MTVILVGNIITGVKAIGPFPNDADARKYRRTSGILANQDSELHTIHGGMHGCENELPLKTQTPFLVANGSILAGYQYLHGVFPNEDTALDFAEEINGPALVMPLGSP
jgi:hypothetical protein